MLKEGPTERNYETCTIIPLVTLRTIFVFRSPGLNFDFALLVLSASFVPIVRCLRMSAEQKKYVELFGPTLQTPLEP